MKKAIIAASFGTTYAHGLEKSISAVEELLRREFCGYEIRRAFTSSMVIAALRKRGEMIDSVDEALEKLAVQGFSEVIIQPTHIISGFEYDKVLAAAKEYKDRFKSLKVGAPLLDSDDDIERICDFFEKKFGGDNAIALMGHGTEHSANSLYSRFAEKCSQKGYNSIYVGTVEGTPVIDDIIPQIKAGGFKKVIVTPLMFVAGDHANNDMAGDEPESWKSRLEKAGFEVVPVIKGLGEYPEIQSMYAQHIKNT